MANILALNFKKYNKKRYGKKIEETNSDFSAICELQGVPAYCNVKKWHIFSTDNAIWILKIASESSWNAVFTDWVQI